MHDLKSVLLDFIAIELAFHVQSMETLTDAYTHIEAIDEEADLAVSSILNRILLSSKFFLFMKSVEYL